MSNQAPKNFTTREEALRHLIQIATAFLEKKPVQIFNTHNNRWDDCYGWHDLSAEPHIFRIKPEPREWWANIYRVTLPTLHETRQSADLVSATRIDCIKVREVIE